MDDNCIISPPVKLNCWKHHARFIKEQIQLVKNEHELDSLPKLLLKIGESQMDLYLGEINPKQVSDFIIDYLEENITFGYPSYKKWICTGRKEYQLVTLPDSSIWTLRLGDEEERYVHIHPGRYSAYTIRVRALTLKTAICILVWIRINGGSLFDTSMVNHIRKKFLDASPLKSVPTQSGLGRLLLAISNL